MAKTKISEYDATAGNNTDIDSISIAEGMLPSNVNNALRELMAHLKDMDAGTQALTSPQLTSVDINGGTIDGITTLSVTGAVTVGVNDTGHDVKFFGATASRHMTWDESADSLIISGDLDVNDGTIKLDGNYPTGTGNVALGNTALDDGSLSGAYNTAIGNLALTANTSGAANTAMGADVMASNTTGGSNSAFGRNALGTNTTGSNNTAVGYNSLVLGTSGGNNTAVGWSALQANTTADGNTAVGYSSLGANTTGTDNVAVGSGALDANTTANYNTAVGGQNALGANTTGAQNTAIGGGALAANTTASNNTSVGHATLIRNTTGASNVAVGVDALNFNTTASNNTALGRQALQANTTASNNTAVGYQAGYSTTVGFENVYLGTSAGRTNASGDRNTIIGNNAGYNSTGDNNTYVGANGTAGGCAEAMTTGSKNTILGGYTGNQNSLDIRTASNYIVLSDGDGNPRVIVDSSGNVGIGVAPTANYGLLQINGPVKISGSVASTSGASAGATAFLANSASVACLELNNQASTGYYAKMITNGGSQVGSISYTSSATSYTTSSDYRLKTDAQPMTGATDRLKQLNPVNFEWISDGTRVDGFLAHEAQEVVPEAVTGTKDAMRDEEYEVSAAIEEVTDEDGNVTTEAADAVMGTRSVPDMQGIDQSKIVPLLTAALQEALTKIDAMEARITALEGA